MQINRLFAAMLVLTFACEMAYPTIVEVIGRPGLCP
jgi:hypothetical protein